MAAPSPRLGMEVPRPAMGITPPALHGKTFPGLWGRLRSSKRVKYWGSEPPQGSHAVEMPRGGVWGAALLLSWLNLVCFSPVLQGKIQKVAKCFHSGIVSLPEPGGRSIMLKRAYVQAQGWAQHCPGRAETIASMLGDFVINRSPRDRYNRWETVRALPSSLPLPLPDQV